MPSAITVIIPGFVTGSVGICSVDFDDITDVINFTRPVIATPSTCSDASDDIWTVWVEPQGSHDSSVFKLSVDLPANQFKITGLSGESGNLNPVPFTAFFMLPDGTTSTFTFIVTDSSTCSSPTFTLPT